MDQVYSSWRESLSLFKPKNFKLFALITLKTIGQVFRLLLTYFWWFPALILGLIIFLELHYSPSMTGIALLVFGVYSFFGD